MHREGSDVAVPMLRLIRVFPRGTDSRVCFVKPHTAHFIIHPVNMLKYLCGNDSKGSIFSAYGKQLKIFMMKY